MSGLSSKECAALLGAFRGDRPEESLAAGLAVLAELGIVQDRDADSPPWLVVAQGERRIALSTHRALSDDDKRIVDASLGVALARAVEGEHCDRISERFDMLSSASFEGIMIHTNGVVVDANQRLADLLGCELQEVLGGQTMRRCVAPEDLPETVQRIRSGFEGAYVITGVRKDGSRFRAELQSKQGKLGPHGVRVVAVRDVSEREATLALLRESETRLRDLAAAAFDLTVLSRDGVVVDVGDGLKELLGYTKDEMLGFHLLDFVAPSARPLVKQALTQGGEGAYEATVVSASGELVPVEIVAVNSTFNGLPTRVAGLRDLRRARQLEGERRKLEGQLERTQRLNSLGVLAGGIAHDFNNLLVGVLGNADMLLAETSDPELRRGLLAIVSAGEKAAGLTRQMLAYAGHTGVAQPTPVDVGKLLSELSVLLAATLSKKAKVTFDVEPGSVVLADRTTLTQVLMNLLTNASDALGSESGTIVVGVRGVDTPDASWDDALGATVGPGDWVLITVTDSGEGMDESTVARMFDPFFSTKAAGHGLGLAACLGIVASHGGALRVDSTPGKGSCFSLLLKATQAAPSEGAPALAPSTAPCRVLVVDDESVVREQLRRCLELRGYSVVEATDGRSALASIEREAVDLVVLDLTMPDMDGATVAFELRRAGHHHPIVLSSGHFDAATEATLAGGSFQAFLRKPYGVAELMAAIHQAQRAAGSNPPQ